jgi:hypothetical protein
MVHDGAVKTHDADRNATEARRKPNRRSFLRIRLRNPAWVDLSSTATGPPPFTVDQVKTFLENLFSHPANIIRSIPIGFTFIITPALSLGDYIPRALKPILIVGMASRIAHFLRPLSKTSRLFRYLLCCAYCREPQIRFRQRALRANSATARRPDTLQNCTS